ncbi:hypothetical protein FI667_g13294, partial [Globisporangium splendens]
MAEEIVETVIPAASPQTAFSDELLDMFGAGALQDSVNIADVRESRVEEELQRWMAEPTTQFDTIAAHIPSHVLVGIDDDMDSGVDQEIIQTFSSASFDDEVEC